MRRGRVIGAVFLALGVVTTLGWSIWPTQQGTAPERAASANGALPGTEVIAEISGPAADGGPLINVGQASTEPSVEHDAGVDQRAVDAAACEILDGVPSRASADDVPIEISAEGVVSGELIVRYGMSAGMWTTPDGKLHGMLEHRARISRQRVTLLRCAHRRYWADVVLDDGRSGKDAPPEDGGLFTIDAVRVFRLSGRLVSGGVGVANVQVLTLEIEHASTADDGRFQFQMFPPKRIKRGTLEILSPALEEGWDFERAPPEFEVKHGTSIDLGDLPVRRTPKVAAGRIGIGLSGDDEPVVHRVIEGSPAERAGVQKGDVVLEVNGVIVQTVADAMRLTPGRSGTSVRLKVRRGAEFLLFDVKRQGAE